VQQWHEWYAQTQLVSFDNNTQENNGHFRARMMMMMMINTRVLNIIFPTPPSLAAIFNHEFR
jgi:hypothetical protein